MSRDREITETAISALENGADPFSRSFLTEHGVTVAERYDLAERLALAARIYLLLGDDLRTDRTRGAAAVTLLARAAGHGITGTPSEIKRAARALARFQADSR